MVKRIAPWVDSLVDAGPGIVAENLTQWRERALHWQWRNPDRARDCFTSIADVTTLAGDCRFAGNGRTLVAGYDGLPFPALSV